MRQYFPRQLKNKLCLWKWVEWSGVSKPRKDPVGLKVRESKTQIVSAVERDKQSDLETGGGGRVIHPLLQHGWLHPREFSSWEHGGNSGCWALKLGRCCCSERLMRVAQADFPWIWWYRLLNTYCTFLRDKYLRLQHLPFTEGNRVLLLTIENSAAR